MSIDHSDLLLLMGGYSTQCVECGHETHPCYHLSADQYVQHLVALGWGKRSGEVICPRCFEDRPSDELVEKLRTRIKHLEQLVSWYEELHECK